MNKSGEKVVSLPVDEGTRGIFSYYKNRGLSQKSVVRLAVKKFRLKYPYWPLDDDGVDEAE